MWFVSPSSTATVLNYAFIQLSVSFLAVSTASGCTPLGLSLYDWIAVAVPLVVSMVINTVTTKVVIVLMVCAVPILELASQYLLEDSNLTEFVLL